MLYSLSDVLNQEELSHLPDDARSKIEKDLTLKGSTIDNLKSDLDKLKGDYEQKCYELDKQIIELSTKLDIETTNCSRAVEKKKELESDLSTAKGKTEVLETAYAESQGEIVALKHSRDIWKEEKLSMQHLMDKRELELKEVKEQWKTVSDKLVSAVASKNELELKLDELQNSGVTAQFCNKRLESEKELLTQQVDKLSNELNAKFAELNSIKLNKDNDLVNLRSQLELKITECKQLKEVNINLRESISKTEKKMEELLQKMKTVNEERQSMEELYREELQSMTNLADLYKASAKDTEEKAKELESALCEMQKVVSESASAQKEAENLVKEWENKAQSMFNEIEMQKKELEKANDLLTAHRRSGPQNLSEEELAALCPTAAMASKFIKSGMTLTEIYTKYVETLDELEVSKHENKRLSDVMDDILQELQEKAPILKQQKEDYERALATVTQLTSQMDAAAIDCQQLKAEADDATRKLGKVEREKKRLQVETADLSSQVKHLLKELGCRGQRDLPVRDTEEDANVSSSSEVIDKHLVTFASIDELQEQNRRLLQVVRDLGDENERRERESQNDEIQALKATLDEAKEELMHLRDERTKQMAHVETIVQQRDMYRVLLSQEPKGAIPLSIISSPRLLKPGKAGGDVSRDGNSDSKALQVLKQEFDEYKKEVQTNNKVSNEQSEGLRSQISNLRTDNAKLKANIDFSNEKYDILKATFENVRKESDMVREKNSKLLVIIQKHELNQNKLSNDLIVAQQEKNTLQTKLDNLRSEIEIIRRSEEHLRSENTSLKRDQSSQSVLLSNLQKIQQSMEKQDFEVRSELRSRIDAQTREIDALRKSSHEALQQKQASLQMIEKQLMKSQQSLDHLETEKQALSAELQKIKEEFEEVTIQKQSCMTKISVLEERLLRAGSSIPESSSSDISIEALKEIKDKVKSLEEENANLKLRCEREQRTARQHKDCAAAVEESLKQANEANVELSETLKARLKNASEHQITLEQRITVLEEENRQLNSKKTSLISEVDRRTSDLNRQLTGLQEELNMALKREKERARSEQEARDRYQEQAHLISDAQNKYQREMLLHADSVKELMELKEKAKLSDDELKAMISDAEQAKHFLDSNKAMWEKQKSALLQENNEIKERNKDLSSQISALHTELENLSKQMVTLQQKQATDSALKYKVTTDAAPVTTEDTAGKSHEQLMDIIRYLRKEKNLHEVKYEVAQTESNRLKQQVVHLQKQTDEIKKSLHAERQKSQMSSSELGKHEALMKKVESLNVLTDSNRMLRAENERFQTELQDSKSALNDLKLKLSPLQTENKQLMTQKDTLEAEKKALEQDVQRWQNRSQQLLQSPKRQDPEEYRKLMSDKQRLSLGNDQLNKELTEKKLEISNLQGEIRGFNQQVEVLKLESANMKKKVDTLSAEAAARKSEMEEKNKTIAQIKRVGRRYKMQSEELQKKLKEMEAKQATEEATDSSQEQTVAANAELVAKVSALEASLTKVTKEKDELQSQFSASTAEIDTLKCQVEIASKKLEDEMKASTSNSGQEIRKLTTERDEMKKQLQEKDDKSKRLLTLAKNRIEQVRREKDELASERDQLKGEAQGLRESLENMKQAVKRETDQKSELSAKVEDLQKQISTANLQQQQQNKVSTVVGHQVHAGSSSSVELRKAVNIRPISTQRVSQVSPMRVTRTARVMPEPQQDAQEGSSSDAISGRNSSHTPSSSHLSSALSAVGTTSVGSSVTRAFVHPMTPSGRHPPVVSSTPTTSLAVSTSSTSEPSQAEALVTRGSTTHTSSSTDVMHASTSSSISSQAEDVSESEQAIVSSSDDQPSQGDESQPQSASPGGAKSSSASTSELEDVPSQSTSADAAVSGSIIPAIIGRQPQVAQKRTYEETENANAPDDIPASSSDSPMDIPPLSKRQRNTPDQSSAAIPGPSSEAVIEQNTVLPPQSSEAGSISSAASQSDRSVHAADTQGTVAGQEDVGTSSSVTVSEFAGSENQSVPTSSGAGDVIVLSSDEEDRPSNFANIEGEQQDQYNAEVESEAIGEDAAEAVETEPIPRRSSIPSRPVLEPLHPTDAARTRLMTRPAPLTPGLVPPTADDGDGIVPCTPTLPTRRHDDYQAINSPHVPAGSVPIRFRFEDVSSQSLQPATGIYSVDNTIMDFTDAARSVPTTPIPASSVTTISHVVLDQTLPAQSDLVAVSSSVMEEGEVAEDDEASGDMSVPTGSVTSEDSVASGSAPAEQQGSSYLQSKRGRRIKLIGGRSRGKGENSPSASNQ